MNTGMNNDTSWLEQQLRAGAARRAEGVAGLNLDLPGVRRRAVGIRRRRRLTTAVVAAAVLAIAVPTALNLMPARPGTTAPAQRTSKEILLNPDVQTMVPPKIDYVRSGTLFGADGSRVKLPKNGLIWVRLANGELMVTAPRQESTAPMWRLDAGGKVLAGPIQVDSGPVASADGSSAAWRIAAGVVVLRQDGVEHTLGRTGLDLSLAGVHGDTVWLNGDYTGVRLRSGTKLAETPQRLLTLAVSSTGQVAGYTNPKPTKSEPAPPLCLRVYGAETGPAPWERCDVDPSELTTRFSPDGSKLSAVVLDPEDGAVLVVFNAADGKVLSRVRWAAKEELLAGFEQAVWEDEEHLLVEVSSFASADPAPVTLFRVGLDGSMERASKYGLPRDPLEPIWMFANQ